MTTISRYLSALALSVTCLAGCAAAPVSKDYWTYTGPEGTLRAPPREPDRYVLEA